MNNVCVSVFMPTYNQKAYIAEAVDHVLRQKTTFPFELVIGEDYSTDGTREIVSQYQAKNPDVIRIVTADTNVGAVANKNRILAACRGKYIAFCDGDDYWHDSEKLQKQVDFLDSHPDYGLVHTDFDKLRANGKIASNFQKKSKKDILEGHVYEELLEGTFISTCTVCARRELLERWLGDAALSSARFIQRDYASWLFIAQHAKIGYLPTSTATKRELRESMSHSCDHQKKHEYYLSLHEIQKIFMDRFPCREQTKKRITLDFHIKNLRFSCDASDFPSAKESYLFLRRQSFLSFRNPYYFILCFIKSKKFSSKKESLSTINQNIALK